MSASISRDEWLSALGAAAQPCDPDAMTTADLAEQFGISQSMALRKMQVLMADGKARRTFKQVGCRRVIAYALVKHEARPATRKR